MNNEVKAVKAKISKLIALGKGGANSNESKMALQRAGELMEEFALTIEDIDLNGEDLIHAVIRSDNKKRPPMHDNLVYLAAFTSVKVWISTASKYDPESRFETNIIGYENDVEMFKFFYHTIERAWLNEWTTYRTTKEFRDQNRTYHGKSISNSFKVGFMRGIGDKLIDLIKDVKQTKTKSGTALVPLKMAKIDEFFNAEMGFKLNKRYISTRNRVGEASANGNAAANNFNFNTPVNGGGAGGQRMIGK